MGGLALNIVIDRLAAPGSPFSERLDELGEHVRQALEEMEEMVRRAAREAGVAEADVVEHAATAVGVVVGNRCRGVVAATAKVRAQRRFPEQYATDTE